MKIKKLKNIRAILFDFDMTLVDTQKGIVATYYLLGKFSKLFKSRVGLGEYTGSKVSEDLEKITSSKLGQKILYYLFLRAFKHEIPSFKVYGKDLLNYLQSRNIKIMIISNNSKKAVSAACKYWKIPHNLILGDEDMKKGREKHQEMSYLIKKSRLKKSNVVYVGDHINDILEARKAGIRIVSVSTGIFSRKELAKYKPDYLVSDINEIKDIIG